jgi:hypothetical protein
MREMESHSLSLPLQPYVVLDKSGEGGKATETWRIRGFFFNLNQKLTRPERAQRCHGVCICIWMMRSATQEQDVARRAQYPVQGLGFRV